jgi:hypothetical protein
LDGAPGDVSGAGDVNGDGLADVIVTASHADPNGSNSGRTYVVLGKADTDMVQLDDIAMGVGGFVLDGEAPDDIAGASARGAGDVNGDGLADIIVGAPGADPNGVGVAGRTYVVFGTTQTANVALAHVTLGVGGFALDGESGRSGVSVSGAGDVNGDGLADVVIGASSAEPNGVAAAGRTYVVFGKADTDKVALADVAVGSGGFALDGEGQFQRSGEPVRGAGDVNGDGLADLLVGVYMTDRSYLVFGGDFSCEGE